MRIITKFAVISLYFKIVYTHFLNHEQLHFPEFVAFESCTIHIITVQVDASVSNMEKKASRTFEFHGLTRPIIHSKHHFFLKEKAESLPKNELSKHLSCGGNSAQLIQSKSQFKFRVSPSSKQKCIVQFYIDPPNCPTWTKTSYLPTNISGVLTTTFFDPIWDYRLKWTFLLSQAAAFRWIFIHCTKLQSSNLEKASFMDGILYMIRRDIRRTYQDFPVSPLTLLFEISTSSSTIVSVTNKLYIVSEIDAAVELLTKIKFMNISGDANQQVMFKWYEFNISNYADVTSLENVHQKLFKFIAFQHHNGAPVLGSTEVYPKIWNQSKDSLGFVLLSLLFQPNITRHSISKEFHNMDHNLRRNFSHLLFEYLPSSGIMENHYGEGYPAYRTRDELYFVTCVATGLTGPSLKGLVSAFDLCTWLLIFGTAAATIFFLHTVTNQWTFDRMSSSLFDSFMVVYGSLLQQQITKNCKCKILFGCWLLAGIVISNSYQGENIRKLTSPLEHKKINTFDQILQRNFTVLSTLALFFKKDPYCHEYILRNWKQFTAFGLNQYSGKKRSLQEKKRMSENLFIPSTDAEKCEAFDDRYFEAKVSTCNSNALVGEFSTVITMYAKLQRRFNSRNDYLHLNYLTLSTEPFEDVSYKLSFQYFPMPARMLFARLHRLPQVGFSQFWTTWDFRLRDWSFKVMSAKRSMNREDTMSMFSNISAVFILLAVLLIFIAAPTFIVEKYFINVHRA